MKPQISIVMPIYNAASYLEEAINSIIDQSYTKWELLLVDDGSTDDSMMLCRRFAAADDRISLISLPHSGVSTARNFGIKNSIGEWISFVDSDDFLPTDSLEKMISASDGADWVIGAVWDHPSNNPHIPLPEPAKLSFTEAEAKTFLYMEKNSAFSRIYGCIYRKKCIAYYFDESVQYGEDQLFNYQNFKQFNIVSVIVENCYFYRKSYSMTTLSHRSLEQRIFISYRVMKAILSIYGDNPEIEQYYHSRFVLRFYNHCVRLAAEGKDDMIPHLLSGELLRDKEIRRAIPPIKELNEFWSAVLQENSEAVCEMASKGKCFRSDSPGKISVILPVYNMENTVERSINSILVQTYENWELIIVDDGSTDSTPRLVDDLQKKDNRISVYHISNGGVSNARNFGIKKAVGEWVAFLDGDDIYMPRAFSLMIESGKDADLVVGGYRNDPPVGNECHLPTMRLCLDRLSNIDDLEGLWNGFLFAVVWNRLYRRSLIKPVFDPRLRYGEDTCFNLQMLPDFGDCVLLDTETYLYTRSADRLYIQMIEGRLEILRGTYKYFPKAEVFHRKAFISYARCIRRYIAETIICSYSMEQRRERLEACEKYLDHSLTDKCEEYLFHENLIWWEQIKDHQYSEVADGFLLQIQKQGKNINDYFGEEIGSK